jgi:histone H3/H4
MADPEPGDSFEPFNLSLIGDYLRSRLASVKPMPFSPRAFEALARQINDYIVDLIDQSLETARLHRSDTVSESHVERASEYLVSVTRRSAFRHLGTIGGVFLGAALSNLLAMASGGAYTKWGVLFTTGFGIVGAFLIALHIARD